LNSIVNRHRIELYILDANGRTAASITRLQWDIDAVLDRVSELLSLGLLSSLPGSLLAIAPKCPVCWSAWLGALGIVGWDPAGKLRWLLPISVGIIIAQAVVSCVRARSNGKGAALLLILSGMILLLIGRANEATSGILVLGVAVLAAGFFVSFLPRHAIRRAEKEHRYRNAELHSPQLAERKILM
jgi:protein SCO1/2